MVKKIASLFFSVGLIFSFNLFASADGSGTVVDGVVDAVMERGVKPLIKKGVNATVTVGINTGGGAVIGGLGYGGHFLVKKNFVDRWYDFNPRTLGWYAAVGGGVGFCRGVYRALFGAKDAAQELLDGQDEMQDDLENIQVTATEVNNKVTNVQTQVDRTGQKVSKVKELIEGKPDFAKLLNRAEWEHTEFQLESGVLGNQKTMIKNQSDMKNNLQEVLKNQQRILKFLQPKEEK